MSDDIKRLIREQMPRIRALLRDEPDPTRGRPGEKGAHGVQGIKGDKGDKGDQGVAGPRGERGLQGDQGVQGTPGADGKWGAKGVAGPQGGPGDKGDKGDRGDRGEKGERGVPGLIGRQGEKGDRGERGDTGLPGPAGGDGEDGLRGAPGTPGSAGTAPQWLTGLDVPGASLGKDGDLYFQTGEANLFQKRDGEFVFIDNIRGPRGGGGGVGADGKPGVTFRTGLTAPPSPASQHARNGDLYLNTVTNDLYQVVVGSYVLVATLGGSGSGTTLPIRVITNPVALLSDVVAGTAEVLQLPSGALGFYANEAGTLKYIPFVTAPVTAGALKYFHGQYFKSRMSYGFGGMR